MKEEKFMVTADVIIERNERKELLLIKRRYEPFRGMWALPGGCLETGKESVEETAVRELEEETGLVTTVEELELVGVYSKPGRDPRGHYITMAYHARSYSGRLKFGDDAEDTKFFPYSSLPELAFDHEEIINDWRRK